MIIIAKTSKKNYVNENFKNYVKCSSMYWISYDSVRINTYILRRKIMYVDVLEIISFSMEGINLITVCTYVLAYSELSTPLRLILIFYSWWWFHKMVRIWRMLESMWCWQPGAYTIVHESYTSSWWRKVWWKYETFKNMQDKRLPRWDVFWYFI